MGYKAFWLLPFKKRDISERKAQLLMMELMAEKLELKKDDLVLDAGCGRGTTTCYLAQKFRYQLIGIDIVPFEIKIARRKANELNLTKNINFYLRDYSKTNFQNNYFEKIFTLETLVHSANLVKTLKEFFRILKSGGLLVLFEYSISPFSNFNPWERKIIKVINQRSAMMSLDKMFHNKLPQFIKEAGFKIVSDEDITDFMIPSAERFYNYAKIPYMIIKTFKWQRYFINTTAGVEFYKMLKKRLVKYRIITVNKQ